jgi:hypothetical protein
MQQRDFAAARTRAWQVDAPALRAVHRRARETHHARHANAFRLDPCPCDPVSGRDFDALAALIEWQIEAGSTGLVPVGTTGESPTLSHEEHEAVIAATVTAAAGRVPVIAGAGSNNTAEAIRFVQHAESVGASAALVVTPYYNKPTQAGLIAHFTALHDGLHPADRHLQHPRPVGGGHDARHHGRTGETAAHHRRSRTRPATSPGSRSSAPPAGRISSSCRARTPRRWASTPMAGSAASRSPPMSRRASAPSSRPPRCAATTPRP